jgi:hypothetical protein
MQVGFETEGTAIFDTMSYIGNEVGHKLLECAVVPSCGWTLHVTYDMQPTFWSCLCRSTQWRWASQLGSPACCCRRGPRATGSCCRMRQVFHLQAQTNAQQFGDE